MAVLMFQKRFAPLVKSGAKRQTIRPKRKHPIKPGDHLSLREWEGVAYRSKQVELLAAECFATWPVTMLHDRVLIKGSPAAFPERFAQADGFDSFAEMVAWFEVTHGLPFHGELIRW